MRTKVTVYLKQVPSAVVFISEDSFSNLSNFFKRSMTKGNVFGCGVPTGCYLFNADDIAGVGFEATR